MTIDLKADYKKYKMALAGEIALPEGELWQINCKESFLKGKVEGLGRALDAEQLQPSRVVPVVAEHEHQLYGLFNTKTGGLMYIMGESKKGVWEAMEESEWMGTGVTRRELRKQGWVARKLTIGLAQT